MRVAGRANDVAFGKMCEKNRVLWITAWFTEKFCYETREVRHMATGVQNKLDCRSLTWAGKSKSNYGEVSLRKGYVAVAQFPKGEMQSWPWVADICPASPQIQLVSFVGSKLLPS